MHKLVKVQIVLYRNPSDPEFLLLMTSGKKHDPIWQGITGGVEESDRSIKLAALRELDEELNMKADEKKIIGPFYTFQFQTYRKGYEGTTATEYCFAYELPKDFSVKLSDEHQSYKWLPFDEAVNLIDHENPKIALRLVFNKIIGKNG